MHPLINDFSLYLKSMDGLMHMANIKIILEEGKNLYANTLLSMQCYL